VTLFGLAASTLALKTPKGRAPGRSNRLQTKTQPEPSPCPKSIPQLPLPTMKANHHGTPVNTGDLHGNLHLAQVLDEVVGKRIVVVDDQDHKTPPPNLAQQAKIQRPKRGHAATCMPGCATPSHPDSNAPSNKARSRKRFQRLGNHLFRYRATGLIYGVFRLKGKVVWRNLGTVDKTEAKKVLAETLSKAERIDLVIARSLTLDKLVQLYDQSLNSFSPGTAENRRCLLGFLKRTWPYGLSAKVADISPVHLRNWLALHKRRLCNSTWNTYLRLLRALFDLAVEAKALTENPASKIEPQRQVAKVQR